MKCMFIFPFITFSEKIQLGDFCFWEFPKYCNEYIPNETARSNIHRYLQIFKDHNGSSVTSCTAVVVNASQKYDDLKDAILALKYYTIESSFIDIYNEHFVHNKIIITSEEIKTFLLEDRNKWIAGATAQTTGYFLPGVLKSERIWNIDLKNLSALYNSIKKEARVRNAFSWYCKSVCWNGDRLENILYLCIAFETFTKIGSQKAKKKKLKDRTRDLVLDSPYVAHWVNKFYKARNKIVHEGFITEDKLIYRDRCGNKVKPHNDIARIIFHEAVRTVSVSHIPSSELEHAIIKLLKSYKVLGTLISNRAILQCVDKFILQDSLSIRRVLTIQQLCGMVMEPDLSLTFKECSYYISRFRLRVQSIKDMDYNGIGASVRRGIETLIHTLQFFTAKFS